MTKLNFSSSLKVSYAMIRSLLLYFNANGFTNDQVLKGTNLSLIELNRTDAYASEDTYDIIFENCVALSEDPFFGMHLGSKLSLHQLGVVGYLLMNSDTFENALYAYQSFQASLGESVVIKTVKIGSLARVTFELYGGVRTGQHRIESFLTALQATCFELTGRKLIYSEIGLNFKLTEPSQEYINMTGVLPKPSDENFVEFSKEYLDLFIINSIPELTPIFEEKLHLQALDVQLSSFMRKVKRELERRIGKEERGKRNSRKNKQFFWHVRKKLSTQT